MPNADVCSNVTTWAGSFGWTAGCIALVLMTWILAYYGTKK